MGEFYKNSLRTIRRTDTGTMPNKSNTEMGKVRVSLGSCRGVCWESYVPVKEKDN